MRRTKVGAEILAFDSIERAAPSDETGDKDYHLRAAVSALAERNRFGNTPVVVSIPEPAFSRFIPLPPVDKKRIPEVVRYEARQQIPFPIEEVVWDYQPVREPTELGEETEVAIFSLRSQFVYALLANLTLCRVRPTAVLPVPLALYNYLTFDRDIAKGTIAIDLGAGSTDILICDPENFRVRNITVSGNGITRALAERLKIDPAEAEQLKRGCTDVVQAQRLFKMIQPTLNDLVGQVQRTIGFFKSQIHNVRIDQALLLGNTFRMPGVSEYFVNQLGCDLMPATALERVTLASGVDSAALKDMLPSLAVAMGLALEGVGQGQVQVNLMPRELLFRQQLAGKRPFAAAAVACLALMLGTNLLSLHGEKSRMEKKLALQQEIKALVKQVSKAEADYKREKTRRDQTAGRLDIPLALSVGYPKRLVGYRGLASALDSINRVLDTMSEAVVINRLTAVPQRIKLKPGDYDGSRSAAEAISVDIQGYRKGRGIDFLERLVADIKRVRTAGGAESTQRFARVGYANPRLLDEGTENERMEFLLHCDFLIDE